MYNSKMKTIKSTNIINQ